ncbi:MAG: FAD-dependent oxidoreductase [Streptococcus parasanguinis]|nr:FAD-dependent oxidoreductase [Streptococcus parasanguinis]
MSKIVVVGANHAGTACINTMLDNFGNENEIVVFDQNSNISFLGCGMALWIGEQIDGPEGLFYSDKEKLEAKGAKVYMNSPVLSIDYDNKVVTAEVDGKEHKESYEKLIFATGSTPIIPPIKGVEIVPGNREFKATLENLQFVKLYQNAEEVIEKLKDNSKHLNRIAVVGGGYIGVELAEAFERLGKDVVLVDIVDTVLNGYYDKDFTDIMAKNLEDHNIRLALGQTVQAVEGDGKVERLVTDKETFDVDMVILAVGFRPNTELLKDKVDMLPNGAIEVNEYMQTSNPDIFAAGDSAVVHYNPSQTKNYIPLATNAVRQGMLVGRNLTEQKLAYRGTQGTSGLYLFGWKIGSTGVTKESAKLNGLDVEATVFEDNYRPEFMPTTEKVLMELVYEKGTQRIVGGQLMSKYDITQSANTLSLAVQNKMTVEDLAISDFFFQPHFDRPWNYLNLLAQAALENM